MQSLEVSEYRHFFLKYSYKNIGKYLATYIYLNCCPTLAFNSQTQYFETLHLHFYQEISFDLFAVLYTCVQMVSKYETKHSQIRA